MSITDCFIKWWYCMIEKGYTMSYLAKLTYSESAEYIKENYSCENKHIR